MLWLTELRPHRLRGSTRNDSGASFLEYSGALVLVGVIVATVFALGVTGVSDRIVQGLGIAICRAFGGTDCGSLNTDPAIPNDLVCNVEIGTRNQAINGSFRNIRVEQGAGDTLLLRRNPVTGEEAAIYTTRGSTSVGVEAANQEELLEELQKGGNNKPNWEVFAQGGPGLSLNYDFKGENAHDEARETRENLRGAAWQRWLATAGGTHGQALEGAIKESARWVEKGWTWLTGGDQEQVDQKYEDILPDSVTIDLNAQAGGNIDYQFNNSRAVSLGVGGSLEGSYINSVRVSRDFERMHTVAFQVDGDLKGQAGLDFSSVVPVKIAAELQAAGGGRVLQRTMFDSDGNPTNVDFEIQYEYGAGVTVGAEGDFPGDMEPDISLGRDIRKRVMNRFSLDLTDPQNLAAVEGLYNLSNGFAAIPDPTAFTDPGGTAADLAERFDTAGEQTRWYYDVEGETGVDGGLKKGGFGVGWDSEESTAELTDAYYRNNADPSGRWHELQC
ncbi:MAG: hypothetical protein M0026_19690 [Nocardiopsaceae bacterium]|nr:hypothetical protein [Nocardiopsaceae bacterium]